MNLTQWEAGGRYLTVDGHRIFVVDRGTGAPIVFVHGFPGSSYDWRHVLPPDRRVIAFDLLGFGLSDKLPVTLTRQADLVESVVKELGVGACTLVGHDIGDTVIAELLHRSFPADRVVLTNGSIFSDLVHLSRGQKLLLALPDRRLPFPVPGPVLRASLRATFTRQPSAVDLRAMESLIRRQRGDRLLPQQIRYVHERRRHQLKWTSALVSFAGRLDVLWGARDPIAVSAMALRLGALRPETSVTVWPDAGHWPALEVPERVLEALSLT
ncbi:hydrolase [Lentzea sp. NBRC 105346]|uniref:alpha/beta fold hydrolase n=1 Tax=Lentzea sp. NBRC 105346 TaxID=3032205 RepID=UPI0024A16ECD|nr:alpha/beta hydrolase [Lentzea sp. NBRC 105346]GLZ31627.1 hydrolase [Lentzea sp. NBRC 105346]